MKSNLLFITIILFTCCISCEEVVPYLTEENNEDNYCINYLKDSPETILLTSEEWNLAKSLFEINNLDYSQLQFYRINGDQLGYHHVRCNQYVNGLRIFTGEVFFHFNANNIYYYLSGHLITQINIDTLSTMKADSVVEQFLTRIDKDDFYKNRIDTLKHGCYDLEFGYYLLNTNTGSNYTKAWKVNFKGREVPYAYINDNTSGVLYYDNGIRY